MNNDQQLGDMTDYVTETLNWAMERMMTLINEDHHEDAIALGDEFIAWANESDKDVISCVALNQDWTMSRTNRSQDFKYKQSLRHPHTYNEMSQLEEMIVDDDLEDFKISGINRIKKRKRLPTAWDDEVVSAHYQEDHA